MHPYLPACCRYPIGHLLLLLLGLLSVFGKDACDADLNFLLLLLVESQEFPEHVVLVGHVQVIKVLAGGG